LLLPREQFTAELASLVRARSISGGRGKIVIFRVLANGAVGGILREPSVEVRDFSCA